MDAHRLRDLESTLFIKLNNVLHLCNSEIPFFNDANLASFVLEVLTIRRGVR